MVRQLHGEEPLVNGIPQAIHDPGPKEVHPGRLLVGEGVVDRPAGEGLRGQAGRVVTNRLEQRMARRDPFQIVLLDRLPVCGASGVSGG
jgi:hypothetical protein